MTRVKGKWDASSQKRRRRAIELDNDLAGKGSEASVNDELTAMLRRCMTY